MVSGVYQLTFPGGKAYIGSSKNVSVRWKEHRWLLSKGKHYNKHLQHSYDKFGTYYESLLCEQPEEDLIFLEQALIDFYCPALNLSRIAGKVEMTPEVRAKMSAAKKGKPLRPEHAAKIRAASIGRKWSAESRARGSAAQKGKRLTEVQRQVISASKKGNKNCVGRKYSSETIEKMRASSRARWDRPEEREKARAAARKRIERPE